MNTEDIKIELMEAIWEKISEYDQTHAANSLGMYQSRISLIKNKKTKKFGLNSLLLIAKQLDLELNILIADKGLTEEH